MLDLVEPSGSPIMNGPVDEPPQLAQQQDLAREQHRLIDLTKHNSLTVSEIQLSNLVRTAPSVLKTELLRQPALWEPSNLEEIQKSLDEVETALRSLDVFEEIICGIKLSEEGPGFCTVVLRVEEKKPLHITAGTYVTGDGEGSTELEMALRNRLGYAESIQLAGDWGLRGSNEFSFSVTKPRPAAKPMKASARFSQLLRSSMDTSSFMQRTRAANFSLSSQALEHSLQYEAGWRTVTDPSRAASDAVARHLGHSLKSALQYTFRHDRHFAAGEGQKGMLQFKSTTEVAGLALGAGVARFVRQHLQGRLTLPLPDTTAFVSLGMDAGVMAPLGRDGMQRRSSISDRFFLGGVASLRGFENNSAGPCADRRLRQPPPLPQSEDARSPPQSTPVGDRQQHDYLGGDLYATVTAAVKFNLPFGADIGLRGHMFMNAGNTALLAGTGRSLSDTLTSFRSDLRCTTGVGILLPIEGLGDIELNYCCPLKFQATDRTKHGLQFGISPNI